MTYNVRFPDGIPTVYDTVTDSPVAGASVTRVEFEDIVVDGPGGRSHCCGRGTATIVVKGQTISSVALS